MRGVRAVVIVLVLLVNLAAMHPATAALQDCEMADDPCHCTYRSDIEGAKPGCYLTGSVQHAPEEGSDECIVSPGTLYCADTKNKPLGIFSPIAKPTADGRFIIDVSGVDSACGDFYDGPIAIYDLAARRFIFKDSFLDKGDAKPSPLVTLLRPLGIKESQYYTDHIEITPIGTERDFKLTMHITDAMQTVTTDTVIALRCPENAARCTPELASHRSKPFESYETCD